jgi:hypothetical protein
MSQSTRRPSFTLAQGTPAAGAYTVSRETASGGMRMNDSGILLSIAPDRPGQPVRSMVMPGTKPEDVERLGAVAVVAMDLGIAAVSASVPCRPTCHLRGSWQRNRGFRESLGARRGDGRNFRTAR